MRTEMAHRSRPRGIASRVRVLVAAVTAVLGVTAGLVAATSGVAGATTVLSFTTGPANGTAGVSQTVVVAGATTNDLVRLTVAANPPTTGTAVYYVSPVTATADASGNATFSLTIDTAGSWTVTATDSTQNVTTTSSPITIAATSASKLLFTTNPPSAVASTTATFSVGVSVTDAYGNVVTTNGDQIQLTTSTAGCQLNGSASPVTTYATSNGLSSGSATGVATFSALTLTGTSNLNCILQATDLTTTYTPANSTSVSVVGLPAKLAYNPQPPATAVYGVPFGTVTVNVEDANGTVESAAGGTGNTDSITLSSSNCVVTATSLTVSAVDGVATFANVMFSGTVTTTCVLTATDTSRTPNLTVNSTGTLTSTNTPSKLGFIQQPPTTTPAGAVMTAFKVATETGNGTPVTTGPNTLDTITISSACTLYGTTTAVEVNGVATFSNVSVQKAGSCTIVATDATAPSLIAPATSNAVTVTAGTPTHLVFTTAPPTTFGSLSTPLTAFAVSVEDAYGNVTSTTLGSTDTIAITSTNCTLTGVTSVAASGGVATFNDVIVTSPGACTLAASDSTRVLTGATATVTVGQPQPTLVVSSTKGFFKTPLKLTTTGGAGTGAVTFTVVNGTAQNCVIVNGTLKTSSKGTCIVTATKAASGNYAQATSAATTVTIGNQLLQAYRVLGPVYMGHRMVIRVSGVGFWGRPRVISNTAGFRAIVAHNTGTLLTIIISSSPRNRAGIHVLVIIEPNGQRAALRFMLRP